MMHLPAASIQSASVRSRPLGRQVLEQIERLLSARRAQEEDAVVVDHEEVRRLALSALLPVRAMMLRNGVPSSFSPFFSTSGPSCVVMPVMPVTVVTRIASSSLLRGAAALWLSWLSGPALTENPRGMRRVRRSVRADRNG